MNKIKSNLHNLLLGVFLIIGFILRFTASITHSYSSDELSAINRLNFTSFSDLLEIGIKTGDMHPAGVQIFLVLWSNLFGTDEIIYRLPFVLLGTASIYLIYLIGSKIDKSTGLISSAIWSVLLFPILQSELARPYSPGLFFTLISGCLLINFIVKGLSIKNKWIWTIGLGLSLSAAMYSHYFSFLTVAIMGVVSVFFVKKNMLFHLLVAGGIAIVLFLPHLNITLHHTSIEGGLQWLPPPSFRWLFDFLWFAFNSSFIITIPLSALIVIGLIKAKYFLSTMNQIMLCWFFGVYVIAFLMSIFNTPVLKFPVMLFPLPFFIILISNFISNVIKHNKAVLALCILLLIGISTTIERRLYSNQHFEVFKELVDPILKWQKQYGEENLIKIMNVSHPNYINFYANRQNESINLDFDLLNFGDEDKLKSFLSKSSMNYCIIGYSGRLTPPYFFNTALSYFPNIIEYKKYYNSAVFLLAKTESSKVSLNKKIIATFPDNQNQWFFDSSKLNTLQHSYILDSTTIYSPLIKIEPSIKSLDNKSFIEIEIEGISLGTEAEITLVISPEKIDGTSVNNSRGESIWIGKDLEKMITSSGKAKFAFSIPKQMTKNDYLKIYLWSRNGLPFKLNNMTILEVDNIWN